MELKNPARFLERNPAELHTFTNSLGQRVRLLEHPEHGDDAPIYAEIEGRVFRTDFHDVDDLSDVGGEYEARLYADGFSHGDPF